MSKRIAVAGLWLVSVLWAWNYVAAMTGLPAALGGVLGIAVALFVAADPLRLFFARPRPVESRPAGSAAFTRVVRGVE
jgi:hypothetical protein